MRIVLAIDSSSVSRRAARLVAAMAWPEGSEIRIVAVNEAAIALDTAPWLGEPLGEGRGPSWEHRRMLNVAVEDAERVVARPGCEVSTTTRDGWAAEEIVREAREWRADLIVVGSHGHGTFGSALLGSVSATVVDRAPCPVLVARTESIERVVLGTDGGAAAEAAVAFIDRHDLFPSSHVEVVGVAQAMVPVGAIALGMPADLELYDYRLAEARSRERQAVKAAAARLAHVNRVVDETVRDGPPAGTLVEVANAHRADLLVVGTRGETGIRRLVHGSVAHDVLLAARCSVLVAHPVSVGRAAERMPEHVTTLI